VISPVTSCDAVCCRCVEHGGVLAVRALRKHAKLTHGARHVAQHHLHVDSTLNTYTRMRNSLQMEMEMEMANLQQLFHSLNKCLWRNGSGSSVQPDWTIFINLAFFESDDFIIILPIKNMAVSLWEIGQILEIIPWQPHHWKQ